MATSVCSSSDLPEPVVPAISACGPSRTRSIKNGPSYPAPSVAVVLRPPSAHPAVSAPGVGGSMPSRSSSRTLPGSALSSLSPTPRSGARARPNGSNQASSGASVRTPASGAAPPVRTFDMLRAPNSVTATAPHSSGSTRSSVSMQIT